ncbi:MAG TPA: ECF-type sigma factor [Steroidobacteraceae bacterium]|jgi:RNA polymerase sigma factor (TIGR02999 family)|nr:ECF-type sigma factor [Steroidobacteraceae bacterium]
MTRDADLGAILARARAGERAALDELFAATYSELRALARARLRAMPRVTVLDTVGLVHESYMRLAGAGRLQPQDRAHFMRYAARAMHSIIVDHARRRSAERRGGGQQRVELTTSVGDEDAAGAAEILRVHDAIEALAATDARAMEVVEMRYFGGMSEPEIAEALGVGERTVRRDWEKARVLLAEALEQ